MSELLLHGYWRSSAAYRVRIALNLKGVAYCQANHDLRTGAQRAADYLQLDPQGLVPVLEVGGMALIQSSAILEWLEEWRPDPPLLPRDLKARAVVRGMAALIACDVHPLNNLRVLNKLRENYGADQTLVDGWARHWINEGFTALEELIRRFGGVFAFGDAPTLADCHLVPQVYSAGRFGVDLKSFSNIQRVYQAAMQLDGVLTASPSMQPDANRE